MKTVYFKKWGLGLCALLITSVSDAKCYPGLDCPSDLPDSKRESPKHNNESWKMISHYQVKGGLAKDITTGLMWMRCSIGQTWNGASCEGKGVEVKWAKAMAIPKHFGSYAGYSDWRLPTIKELNTLVYCSNGHTIQYKDNGYESIGSCGEDYKRPTIEQSVFPNTASSDFWSASPNANTSYSAWYVGFYYGHSNYYYLKSNSLYVRLVRTGQ